MSLIYYNGQLTNIQGGNVSVKKEFQQVYQFKITLKGTKLPVWRRIQVPETYTFWDLHVAIQDAMGWDDYHLHEFKLVNPVTKKQSLMGIPDDEPVWDWERETLPGWKQKIAKWFSLENRSADYLYDFGDGWEHKITLEKILPREGNTNYPICLAGKRACPPEDCGGVWGYEEICNGESEFQEEYSEYDPEYFDPKEVYFDDPLKRKKLALG